MKRELTGGRSKRLKRGGSYDERSGSGEKGDTPPSARINESDCTSVTVPLRRNRQTKAAIVGEMASPLTGSE